MESNQPESLLYHCAKCNAELTVPPGATELTCPYCGHQEKIAVENAIEEQDFNELVRRITAESITVEEQSVHCDGCGASITIDPKVHAHACPYCGKSYIASNRLTGQVIAPAALLPFKITAEKSSSLLRDWAKKRWFAPNDFARSTKQADTLRGIYLPFWTFDSDTESTYTGQRGVYYYVTERRTVMENGKNVVKSVQVRKTRWYFASGKVSLSFDDLLICGSDTLPRNYVQNLEPWDLKALVPYDSAYLQGYGAERYTIQLPTAFESAKNRMEEQIRSAVRRDIGGDEQQITTLHSEYHNVSCKHILLPVWITAYRYGDKVYRIMINARTGEVQGERPWSWVKITLTALFILLLFLFGLYQSNGGSL